MLPLDEYCRAIEAHLCRKNDGHLIRIVGPAFELVSGWAGQGIPVSVACTGVDRYSERYYRKGPRRRPVRIEFCDADVLDAFDEWRRAVGVSVLAADSEGGPVVEEPVPAGPRPRRSLRAHIEAAMARLMALRASANGADGNHAPSVPQAVVPALAAAIDDLEPLLADADRARGETRQRILDALSAIDARVLAALDAGLPDAVRAQDLAEATGEVEPFRTRLSSDAFDRARRAAVTRLRRERYGLPEIGA